jgi:antitoxin component YwqK of YwqJK toxin-antitoxin module
MKSIIYKLLSLAIMLVVFVGCNNSEEVVISTYPDGQAKLVRCYDSHDSTTYKEIQYYDNNQKKLEGKYIEGQKSDEWTAWYRNGSVWSKGYFKNGKSDGRRTIYNDNGIKYITGEYSEGVRVGVWEFYDSVGVLIKKVDYSTFE